MDGWLAQYFFNPTFVAGGAALAAAPIIIHLINRMRFRRVRFAAMEFLLQSQERNRRRLLFEQLLLLLLRILIVLAIVALLARLILDPSQLSMFRGAKAHHLVLLDDSGSMQNRWGETTAFQESLAVIKKLVSEGAQRPNTQQLTLLRLSNPEQPLFTQRDVNETFLTEVETKLENLKCSHQSLNLVEGLDAARQFLAEEKATIKHLHVISDFRRRDWLDQKAISNSVQLLDEAGVTVNLVRTVPESNDNLAVTELTGDLQVAAPGVPVRMRVGVKNFGEQVAREVRLSVLQDGEKLPLSIQFDKIEAGEEVFREFDITFQAPKKYRVQVGLEADPLDTDNTRYLAIDVSESNPVLIIDGDPSGDEGSYLADVLDPSITGFTPQIEPLDYLRKRPLDDFQSIYLLNVGQIPPDALKPLEEYVATGGGLAWFLGDTVNPSFYNDKLYNEGEGLFPVRLGTAPQELPQEDSTNPGPDLQLTDHPIFGVFEGQENPYIEVTRVFTYFPVADDWQRDDQERKDGVQTIAFLRNKAPLMFEHRYGAGKVITCLTSCGPSWNNWATYASFVIFQLELEKYIARTDDLLARQTVGQSIDFSLDPAVYTEMIEITAPASAGKRITRLKAAPEQNSEEESDSPGASEEAGGEENSDLKLVATYRETDMPGVYTVKLLDQNQIPEENWIAYNVPIEESDLQLAKDEEIRTRLGDDVRVAIQAPGNFQWIEGKNAGQDVRRLLLIFLVSVLLAEQLLAYRLSYHPKTAGAAA